MKKARWNAANRNAFDTADDQATVLGSACHALKKWLLPALRDPASLTVEDLRYIKLGKTHPLYLLEIRFSAKNGFGNYTQDTVVYYADMCFIYQNQEIGGHWPAEPGTLSEKNREILNDRLQRGRCIQP